MATEPTWPDSATLYQPCDLSQGLLHENASCLAVKTHLIMCHLPFDVQLRANAEFMAPCGKLSKLPLLSIGSEVFAEFQPIAVQIADKMAISMHELEDDLWANVTWVENTFSLAEIYISFMDKDVYKNVTYPRIKCAYPWPLNYFRAREKKNHCLRVLSSYQWHDMSFEDVIEKVEKCCQALVEKLEDSNAKYFGGENPCELDAIVFGHLFTIFTTKLSNDMLPKTLMKFPELVDYCRFVEEKYFKTHQTCKANQKSSCTTKCETRN